jgi:hypothetical protein
VEVKHEMPEPDARIGEPLDDGVEGRAFFRDEQDALPVGDTLGDQVGDRLALARARRPLNDQMGAALGRLDGGLLGRVAEQDMKFLAGGTAVRSTSGSIARRDLLPQSLARRGRTRRAGRWWPSRRRWPSSPPPSASVRT